MTRSKALAICLLIAFMSQLKVFPEESAPPTAIKGFKVSPSQPFSPGDIVAEWITEEKGNQTPHKRHTLIYTGFENNTIKLLLEHTVIQWEGWQWAEVKWFSSATENQSCTVSSYRPECNLPLGNSLSIRLKVLNKRGEIMAEKSQTDILQ